MSLPRPKLLLDTHAFLFAINEPELLTPTIVDLLTDAMVPRWVSVVSLWEIAVKIQIGKLRLPSNPEFYSEHMHRLRARALAVDDRHAFELFKLPLLHKDPFDRLLVAQASAENFTLVTRDQAITQYPIRTLW